MYMYIHKLCSIHEHEDIEQLECTEGDAEEKDEPGYVDDIEYEDAGWSLASFSSI